MCGRYLRRSDKQKLAEAFHIAGDLSGWALEEWNYNVAPGTFQPVVRLDAERGDRELAMMRWGFVPFFAQSTKEFGYDTINAKAETLATSRIYKGALERRRCLVPADGFYEWKVLPTEEGRPAVLGLFGEMVPTKPAKKAALTKQPYCFTLRSGAPFAFAGLWERWRDPANAGQPLETYTVITTEPNELTAEVHTRMPAILAPKDYGTWLHAEKGKRAPVELLKPFPSELMQAQKANQDVGNVKKNGPELMDEYFAP